MILHEENGKLIMNLPLDSGISKLLTKAMGITIHYYGEPMIDAMEERGLNGGLETSVSYQVIDGPCKGRRFKLSFTLEPVTH